MRFVCLVLVMFGLLAGLAEASPPGPGFSKKITQLRERCREISAGTLVLPDAAITVLHRGNHDDYMIRLKAEPGYQYVVGTITPTLERQKVKITEIQTSLPAIIEDIEILERQDLTEADVDRLLVLLGRGLRFNAKGGLVHVKAPTWWYGKRTNARLAKLLESFEQFSVWFLDSQGGQKDLITNGVPPDVMQAAISLFHATDAAQDTPPSVMRISAFEHYVGSGDRYDWMTTGRTGESITNVYVGGHDISSRRSYRVLVEQRRVLFIIDTLRSGEQLVRVVKRGSRAWQEIRRPAQ
jgi:hypothetical protein